MRATGMIRRVDEIGRLVLPSDIRKTLKIRNGDPIEIFVNGEEEVILKKYSPFVDLIEIAEIYVEALYESIGFISLVTNRDMVIAVAGAPKDDFFGKLISEPVQKAIEERQVTIMPKPGELSECYPICEKGGEEKFTAQVIAPVIAGNELIGAVILGCKEAGVVMGNMEVKIATTTAGFLAKQIEC